jgi:hypothetical protein
VSLIFEHVVPRWKIVRLLLAATTSAQIRAALEMIVTWVVLKHEDGLLDRSKHDFGNAKEDWWQRYDRARIRMIRDAVEELAPAGAIPAGRVAG